MDGKKLHELPVGNPCTMMGTTYGEEQKKTELCTVKKVCTTDRGSCLERSCLLLITLGYSGHTNTEIMA